MSIRLLYIFLPVVLTCCSYSNARGQHYNDDSLIKRISSIASKQSRTDILLKVAAEIKCSDSSRRIKYINYALQLAEESNYKRGIATAYLETAEYYENCTRQYAHAIKWFEQCLSVAVAQNDLSLQFSARNNIADCYNYLADYTNALKHYKIMLSMPLGRDTLIQVSGNIGGTYQNMGDYTNALTHYQKAYNMVYQDMTTGHQPTGEDSMNLMGLKLVISNIYMAIPDYKRAMDNYSEILEWNEAIQLPALDILVHMGIGDCYLHQGNYKEAIKSYKNTRTLLDGMKESIDKNEKSAQVLERLAEAYMLSGHADSAYYFITRSLSLAEGLKGHAANQLQRTYLTMGKIMLERGKHRNGITYLQKAIDMAMEAGAMEIHSEALLMLSHAYEKTGQTQAALKAYRKHITLRDSMYSQHKITQLTRIDMQGYYDRRQLDDSLELAAERTAAGYKLQQQRLLTYSGFGGLALILLLMFFVFRSYKNEKRTNKIISESNAAIQKEKQVSEELLLNILPEEVAQELKQKGSVEARQFDNVSVLFTDFVDFTLAGERLSPRQLVAELHDCFKVFDEIMDKYGIEKIKTIGDAYMAVCGLPVLDEGHAVKILQAAREISSFIETRRSILEMNSFDIRIGISSGSVVAGIVGVRKFAYDIWGDTVNTAARMEQSGAPGKINISEYTYELVKDNFECEYRGEIPAKNKGKMKMYFVK